MFSVNEYKKHIEPIVTYKSGLFDRRISEYRQRLCIDRVHTHIYRAIRLIPAYGIRELFNQIHPDIITYEIARLFISNYPAVHIDRDMWDKIPEKFKDDELTWSLIEKQPHAIRMVKDPSVEMCKHVLRKDSLLIISMKQTQELCEFAVDLDWTVFSVVDIQTEEMCIKAVKGNWRYLHYVKNKTWRVKREALKGSIKALQHF